MKRIVFLLIFGWGTLLGHDHLEQVGDIGQYAIPLSALTLSFIKGDKQGSIQLIEATAVTLAITYGLKYACNTPRPNGGCHSFPSGHSASSFAGAAFLDRRYGLQYGFPAYLAAAFVGYTRVEAKAHRPVDIVAAAAIAYLSNTLLTTKWHCTPSVCDQTYSLSLHRDF